ncbi:MAG: copper amine oxidase N-terminal domain-containing protein [Ruminococcaceae bacterium]|nr:copper amine oxidase N-terminal domain-containing protein [Oscillospiraceae bacterium]
MHFKRVLSAVLAAAMLLPAAACAPEEAPAETTSPTESTETTVPTETTEAETTTAEPEPVWDPSWPVKEVIDPAVTRKLSMNRLSEQNKTNEEADKPLTVLDVSSPAYKSYHDSEIHNTAPVSMKWVYAQSASIQFSVPKDLSAYKGYSFSVFVPATAVDEELYIYFESNSPASDGMAYYGRKFRMTEPGWNHFSGPLTQFTTHRTPAGWNQIERMVMYNTGWDQANRQDTVVYLDNIYFHTNLDAVDTTGVAIGDAFAFSVGGPRAVYDTDVVEISYIDDTSAVFEEMGVYWLPLSVFAAVLDKDSDYNAASRTLNMTLGGKKYTFVGDKNTAQVNGKSEKLDFTVRVIGDSLFVPHTYAQSLFGYSEMYTDEMELIILSKDKRQYDMHRDLRSLLNVSYSTLFTRPSGEEIVADMYAHLGGDVHPRIGLTEADFDRLREYNKTDATFQKWYAELEKKYDINSGTFKEAPVTRSGVAEGDSILSIARKAMNKIVPMCFLYKMTGDMLYASRVWMEINALCNFKDWDHGHFLSTGEISYAIAIAYDWLYHYWSPKQRTIMENAMLEFGLKPGLDCYEGRTAIWGNSNWSGVCNGGMTSAALAFAAVFPDECTRVLNASLRNLELSMHLYAPDGGYLESLGYWALGTNYIHVLISSLDSACGTDYGMYNSPGFSESAYFTAYFETEVGSWGFHDSGTGDGVSQTKFLSWFAKKSGDPSVNRLRRNSLDRGIKEVHVYDLLWYDPENIVDSVQLNLDSYYSEVGSVTMRSTWEDKAMFVGLHGGDNNAGHGDLDIGNFILDACGERFFIDLGSDDYDLPGFFKTQRWSYYRKRAEGQNTLIIGDVSRNVPDQRTNAIGTFTRVENNDASSIAILDTTKAYDLVKDGKRGILFTDNRSTVILQDEVQMDTANIVRWVTQTEGNITIQEGGRSAIIRCGNYSLYCEIVSEDASLQFSTSDAVSYDPTYENHKAEYSREGIRRLMINAENKVKDYKLAVVFKVIPSGEKAPAPGTLYTWTDMENWKLQ